MVSLLCSGRDGFWLVKRGAVSEWMRCQAVTDLARVQGQASAILRVRRRPPRTRQAAAWGVAALDPWTHGQRRVRRPR